MDLMRHRWLLREFYLNFDCDVHCTDLLTHTMQLLSKTAIPGKTRLKKINLLALKCLRKALTSLCPSTFPENFDPTTKPIFPPEKLRKIRAEKKQKTRILECIELFNKKPKKGLILAKDR
eukprot:UN28782